MHLIKSDVLWIWSVWVWVQFMRFVINKARIYKFHHVLCNTFLFLFLWGCGRVACVFSQEEQYQPLSHLITNKKMDFIRSGWLITCLDCLMNASPPFPFISPTSWIGHLWLWELQHLICEVDCLSKLKAVHATDNCYRQKDNCNSDVALS